LRQQRKWLPRALASGYPDTLLAIKYPTFHYTTSLPLCQGYFASSAELARVRVEALAETFADTR